MNENMDTENLEIPVFVVDDEGEATLVPDSGDNSDGETSYEETAYISEDDREIVEA